MNPRPLPPIAQRRPRRTACRRNERSNWLRVLAETWATADVREARSQLLSTIYERIVVAGRTFVGARLTPAAYAHRLSLALPEQVVMARPTGVRRPVPATSKRVPIE